ncbi:hypothetical protein [Thermus scotoductus]|uniref:hypothetical protein n=1 Tax=Thermus scotoductus TaxID=37636 RepID=UPI000F80623E|nr:hypothetical protein [Thermus scotoductus]
MWLHARTAYHISPTMGNSLAARPYPPAMTDVLLMFEASARYPSGPARVFHALGQEVGRQDRRGTRLHAELGGTLALHHPT